MGAGTRIRTALLRRLGASMRDPFGEHMTDAGKNAPPSHVSEIIKDNISKRDDREHQRKMALYSAIGYAICVKFVQNIWDDGFEFVDDDGNVIMQDISKKMRDLNYIHHATQASILEFIYGHSYMFFGPEKGGGDRIANLDVFGPENSDVIEFDEDGRPKTLEVTVLKGVAKGTQEIKKRIDIKHLVHFRTRPRPYDRSFEGLPMLYSVWNALIGLERALHSSDFYLSKIGHGMFTVFTKRGLGDTKMTRMENTMAAASISRTVVVNGSDIENIKFINATGTPINFPAEIDVRLGLIAAGVGIPKDVLIGLSAGSITGSEVNIKLLYQSLNQHQTGFDNAIRQGAQKLGAKNNDYNIRFITRYAHDEEQKSRIEMNHAQELAIRSSWLSTNEVRDLDGYGTIEGGEGLSNDIRVDVQGFQTPEEAEQTHNKEGVNT